MKIDGAISIRVHDYHILVVNGKIPDQYKTLNFLRSLDLIVLLQWTICTDAQLTDVLKQLWLHQEASRINNHYSSYVSRLRCIILPQIMFGRTEVRNISKSCSVKTSNLIKIALSLNFTILKLGQFTQAGQVKFDNKRVESRNKSDMRIVTAMGDDMKRYCTFYRVQSMNMQTKHDLLTRGPRKGLSLFQKFSVGELELIPLQEFHANARHRFDALILWHPQCIIQNSDTLSKKDDAMGNHIFCCSHQDIQETSMINSVRKPRRTLIGLGSDAIREIHSLVQRFITPPNTHHNSWCRSSLDEKNKRSGISQSKTFTSGLNRCSNRPKNLSCLNHVQQTDNLANGGSLRVDKPDTNSVVSTKEDELNSQNKTPPAYHNTRTDALSVHTQPVLRPIDGSESYGCYANLMTENSEEFPINISIGKSTSYPSALANEISEKNGSSSPPCVFLPSWGMTSTYSMPYSATVLLAIPEVGESDYHAESPQCLTEDDLRNLGLYDDEEDDEDETSLENSATSSPIQELSHDRMTDCDDMFKLIPDKMSQSDLMSLESHEKPDATIFNGSLDICSLISSTTL